MNPLHILTAFQDFVDGLNNTTWSALL